MSFLAACDSKNIRAIYHKKEQALVITACGECPGWYIGPFIEQDQCLGGLKFSLRSYAGGFEHPQDKHFDLKHKVRTHLPSDVINSKSIIFVTENAPNGYVIPILYTGWSSDEASHPLPDLSSSDAPGQQITGSILPPIPFITQEGKLFRITASFDPNDKVNVKFNPNALKMVNASIQEKSIIVWEFDAIALGQTLVEVATTIFFPPPQIGVEQKVQYYDVSVVVLQEDVKDSESKVA